MDNKLYVIEEPIEFPQELQDFIHEWKNKPGNLIPILHKVQETFGYVSKESAIHLSELIDCSVAKIYGVISFYHLFKTTKPGKFQIQVCTGTACYLKGANDLIEELKYLLKVEVGDTTDDGLFSLETVRCIGCCGLAPVIMIGDKTFGNLKRDQLAEIIANYTKS